MLRKFKINVELGLGSDLGCPFPSLPFLFLLLQLLCFIFCYLCLIVVGFWYADNRDCGKLEDNLSPSLFDILVSVLRRLLVERGFKALLMPKSIRDVIKHLEDSWTI